MNISYIKNKNFSEERALYNIEDTVVENCRFAGEEDGESFLKECKNITVKNCFMDLRYPMWHVSGIRISDCEMTKNCRAALWYDREVYIENCLINGIKALRECYDITLKNITADSPEFAWRCKNINISDSALTSEYAFFESNNIDIDSLDFSGKYSFQYVNNLKIKNSKLKTKDAFWHARNVTVTDSVIDGEYLGWYSDGLTFVRCQILGTQPLCYCKNLRLVDCTMENCDLSFEYSEVNADIKGDILSVKNPISGRIVADGYGDIILKDSKYNLRAEILARKAAVSQPNLK